MFLSIFNIFYAKQILCTFFKLLQCIFNSVTINGHTFTYFFIFKGNIEVIILLIFELISNNVFIPNCMKWMRTLICIIFRKIIFQYHIKNALKGFYSFKNFTYIFKEHFVIMQKNKQKLISAS